MVKTFPSLTVGVTIFIPRKASTGVFQRIVPCSGSMPASSSRPCTRICGTPPSVVKKGDEKALPFMPPPSAITRQITFPVPLSSRTNPPPACTYTESPRRRGLETKPKAGSGLSKAVVKSTRQISAPVAASRQTRISRIPAT